MNDLITANQSEEHFHSDQSNLRKPGEFQTTSVYHNFLQTDWSAAKTLFILIGCCRQSQYHATLRLNRCIRISQPDGSTHRNCTHIPPQASLCIPNCSATQYPTIHHKQLLMHIPKCSAPSRSNALLEGL